MIKVSVQIDGVNQSTTISDESYEILEESSLMFNLAKEWFLFETVKAYGVLTEMNLLRLIQSKAIKFGLEDN
jgi:hypothetical protein